MLGIIKGITLICYINKTFLDIHTKKLKLVHQEEEIQVLNFTKFLKIIENFSKVFLSTTNRSNIEEEVSTKFFFSSHNFFYPFIVHICGKGFSFSQVYLQDMH